jgi:hypothetical protein
LAYIIPFWASEYYLWEKGVRNCPLVLFGAYEYYLWWGSEKLCSVVEKER